MGQAALFRSQVDGLKATDDRCNNLTSFATIFASCCLASTFQPGPTRAVSPVPEFLLLLPLNFAAPMWLNVSFLSGSTNATSGFCIQIRPSVAEGEGHGQARVLMKVVAVNEKNRPWKTGESGEVHSTFNDIRYIRQSI